MLGSLDPNIQLRVLIVDADGIAAGRVSQALSRVQASIGQHANNQRVSSILEAYRALDVFAPNVVFVDLVSTGIRDSVTFVQHVRTAYPKVVFVLYSQTSELTAHEGVIYSSWGSRLRHYFLLPKETADESFEEMLVFNLTRVQLDLYAYGAQESLSRMELTGNGPALSSIQLSKLSAQVKQLSRDLAILVDRRDEPHSHLQERRAFVIMAFVEELSDVYELGIKECLSKYQINAYRVDQHYGEGLIIQRIYEDIHESKVVIAELTHPRPNCYYELGFAEALGKPIVRLARVGTSIPFDVSQYPFILYSSLVDLRRRLADALVQLGVTTQ